MTSPMNEKGSPLYQLTLLTLSIYVLAMLVLESFVVDDPEIRQVLQYIDFLICLVFLSDFVFNLYLFHLTENKQRCKHYLYKDSFL